ncbi:AbiA family abortive infection protein [Metabacillus niabensis]|uniref:AbiA family abortive infection protein n=2 Tax=Metabacillus niabensis TaxID=324854 RepID=A0ABT9Z8K3_9BACI|nr:AbiA family abortive infection protein [Metabacillus niabensis]MDQ0228594.1 AbiA family abortive infection protein [Metabacillus niabensis]
MKANKASLGYFIDYNMWKDSNNLQEKKIELMEENSHFVTFNVNYFRNIKNSLRRLYSSKCYFNSRISNNIFYDLRNEYFIRKYALPKNIYGIRDYSFISYGLNLIHNSIGLYLLKITDDFIYNYFKKIETIESFYGGSIRYQNNKINFSQDNIYYRNEYKKFRQILTTHTKDKTDYIVIRLDIQNYFDNLPVENLLEYLQETIKPNDKVEHNYDENTIKEIETFYKFIMNNKKGIPQIDNCILSAFMGYLYLCFLDLKVDSLMKSLNYKEYKIIRYMDDIYIPFKPKETSDNSQSIKEAVEILGKIKDIAFYDFQLHINNKTKIYNLSSPKEKEEFFKDTKNESVIEYLDVPIDLGDETEDSDGHEQTIKKIFDELENIKNGGVNLEINHSDINQYILHKIFDRSISNLLNKNEYKLKIEEIFTNFNYDLLSVSPLVLTILVMKSDKTKEEYINYLLQKDISTSNARLLVIEALRQSKFNHTELFLKLYEDKHFKDVLLLYETTNLNYNNPGYFELSMQYTYKLLNNNPLIIKQMELRVLNEMRGDYSVALNHLVNEFQSICYSLNEKDIRNFNANSVEDFLKSASIEHSICIKIRNMFDRRNNNLVSHSGDENVQGTAVTRAEYTIYKEAVSMCLTRLEKFQTNQILTT